MERSDGILYQASDGILYEASFFESPDPYELAAKTPYPYQHGQLSKIYQNYAPEKRKKVNEDSNEQFRRVTGFTGKLDPKNPDHKELIWKWFRIRDVVMELKYGARPTDSSQGTESMEARLSKLEERVDDNEYIDNVITDVFEKIKKELNENYRNFDSAITNFMSIMALDKLAFEKTTASVINTVLESLRESVIDIVLDTMEKVSEKVPLLGLVFKAVSVGRKAYKDAKEKYEKITEAKENLDFAHFIDQFRTSFNDYLSALENLLIDIRKSIMDILRKSNDLEARKAFANLIAIIGKIVIQFIASPKSRYELDLCKNYIKTKKGFIVMAVLISYYNKKTRSLLINEEIIKIHSVKASNLEELLNNVIRKGELAGVDGIIDLPIKKLVLMLDEEDKAKIRWMCTIPQFGGLFRGGYPRCLVETEPQIIASYFDQVSAHLSENNSLEQPIKDEKTKDKWRILEEGGLGGLRYKNFSS